VSEAEPREILAVANETVAGRSLLEALQREAAQGPIRVTVLCPINHPREGYVVYEDTRRAAAGRRLDKTLELLRDAGVPAHGLVVDADPVSAVRDAIAQLEPDAIVISTHPESKSGWLRRDVVERVRAAAGSIPVEHVVADMEREEGGQANVLVVANETVIGEPLLERIRERARRSPASFLIVAPQSDLALASHPEAERRLRNALATLRSDGIEAHGQIAHPDPFTAAMQAVSDERIDQIIVSTFPGERSGWLKRDVVGRLRKATRIPVEHVVVEAAAVGAAP
jgi:hypothetical protein